MSIKHNVKLASLYKDSEMETAARLGHSIKAKKWLYKRIA